MVIVNTVVYVRDAFGRDASDVAWALGASGAGAMLAALLLPRLLDRTPDRLVMLSGGGVLAAGLALALGSMLGLAATASILAAVAATAVLVASLAWRADTVAAVKPARVAAQRA